MHRRLIALGWLLLVGCPSESETSGETEASSTGAQTSEAEGSTASQTQPMTDVTGSTSSAETTVAPGSTTAPESTTTGGSSSAGDESTAGSSSGEQMGCAMDLVFVVDNSGSMEPRLATLLEALPGFIDGLDGIDLRAMVVDADANPQAACVGGCGTGCYDAGACGPGLPANPECLVPCFACIGHDCDAPPPPVCDVTLGAGLVVEQGNDDAPCGFTSGERWIDATEPSFADALTCAANVGFAATEDERVMDSLLAAVANMGEAAACNEGFLRPGAGLAVVVVTDEADTESSGTPGDWAAALEGSQRDPEQLALAAIIGDAGQPGALCFEEENGAGADAPSIRALASMLGERGVVGSVCADSFSVTLDAFSQVVSGMCRGG